MMVRPELGSVYHMDWPTEPAKLCLSLPSPRGTSSRGGCHNGVKEQATNAMGHSSLLFLTRGESQWYFVVVVVRNKLQTVQWPTE